MIRKFDYCNLRCNISKKFRYSLSDQSFKVHISYHQQKFVQYFFGIWKLTSVDKLRVRRDIQDLSCSLENCYFIQKKIKNLHISKCAYEKYAIFVRMLSTIYLMFLCFIFPGAQNYLNVTAIIGHNAEIPCELTPHTKTDNAYLVLWWFEDIFGTPIYR